MGDFDKSQEPSPDSEPEEAIFLTKPPKMKMTLHCHLHDSLVSNIIISLKMMTYRVNYGTTFKVIGNHPVFSKIIK